jgi:hypothetical protein
MPLIATCHCGSTKFEVPHAPKDATECNCTFCSKTGGLWAYYKPEELRVLSEADAGVYAPRGFNKHHFCAKCGCSTYGVTPDWTLADVGSNSIPAGTKIGINIRLLDDFDIHSVPIQKIDGRHLW